MKIKTIYYILLLFTLFFQISGCATVFKGYFDVVELGNVPSDLKIYDINGVEIPPITSNLSKKHKPGSNEEIKLRTNTDHVLIFKTLEKEKRKNVYRKISFTAVFFDVLFFGFPVIIDAYTGVWNYFDDIYVDMD